MSKTKFWQNLGINKFIVNNGFIAINNPMYDVISKIKITNARLGMSPSYCCRKLGDVNGTV